MNPSVTLNWREHDCDAHCVVGYSEGHIWVSYTTCFGLNDVPPCHYQPGNVRRCAFVWTQVRGVSGSSWTGDQWAWYVADSCRRTRRADDYRHHCCAGTR